MTAYVMAALVVVQSAASVFASTGLRIWVREGNVLDARALDSGNLPFTGAGGLTVHSVTGMMVIPVVALVLLGLSFRVRAPGAVRNATIVLVLVLLQVALGEWAGQSAYLGLLHGLLAIVLFAGAMHTGRAAGGPVTSGEPASPASA